MGEGSTAGGLRLSILVALCLLTAPVVVSFAQPTTLPTRHALIPSSGADALRVAPAQPLVPVFTTSAKAVSPTLFGPGDTVTYTVVISNSGSDKAFSTSMIDSLPDGILGGPGIPFVDSGQVTTTGSVVTWQGRLLPGAEAVVRIPATINTCEWPLTNTATISDLRANMTTYASASGIEGFESLSVAITPTFPPAGWISGVVTGTTAAWSLVTAGTTPTAAPHQGMAMAQFNSYSANAGDSARLATRPLSFPADYAPQLSFWMYHDSDSDTANIDDRVQIQVSTNGGTTFSDVPDASFARHAAIGGWSLHTVGLLGYVGQANVRIGFLGISDSGTNIYIDDIGIQYIPLSGTYSYAPISPLAGQIITFTGTTISSTNAYTKTWDFGDGSRQSGNPVTHTFVNSGTYNVSMAVCGLSVANLIHVSASPVSVSLSLTSSSPTLLSTPTYFTATLMAGSLPITYTWDFGDGSIVNGDLVMNHTYAAIGNYTAVITAENGAGPVALSTPVTVNPLADLAVTQSAEPLPTSIAKPLTFTLVVSNLGPASTAGVVLKETLPLIVSLSAALPSQGTCTSNVNVTTCSLGTMPVGGVATVTLQVRTVSVGTATNQIEVSSSAPDPTASNNSASLVISVGQQIHYFPFVVQHFPAIPQAPVLNPISDPSGNGSYTILWSQVDLATAYTLEEDVDPSFANPVKVYSGTGTSWDASGKGRGLYYYRVQAWNPFEVSAWSNVQLVHVTLPLDGSWTGRTSQSQGISFQVTQNAITSLTLYFTIGGCNYVSQQSFVPPVAIAARAFTLTRNEATFAYVVTGTFPSDTSAGGGMSLNAWDGSSNPPCLGSVAGTWAANRTGVSR